MVSLLSAIHDPWEEVPVGQLSDVNLEYVRDATLQRDADRVVIEQAAVVLHVGEVVWRIDGREARREFLGPGDAVDLPPGAVASIVTEEMVRLPACASGHIFPKGKLASIGLLASSTTIDPGFEGYLRVTVINGGAAPVRLPRGLPIAKAEITRLPVPVRVPYGARDNVKVSLPRDDSVFCGQPLVQSRSRFETVVPLLLAVAGLLLIGLCVFGPLGRWAERLLDGQGQRLFIAVVATIVSTAVLGLWRRLPTLLRWSVRSSASGSSEPDGRGYGNAGGREGAGGPR